MIRSASTPVIALLLLTGSAVGSCLDSLMLMTVTAQSDFDVRHATSNSVASLANRNMIRMEHTQDTSPVPRDITSLHARLVGHLTESGLAVLKSRSQVLQQDWRSQSANAEFVRAASEHGESIKQAIDTVRTSKLKLPEGYLKKLESYSQTFANYTMLESEVIKQAAQPTTFGSREETLRQTDELFRVIAAARDARIRHYDAVSQFNSLNALEGIVWDEFWKTLSPPALFFLRHPVKGAPLPDPAFPSATRILYDDTGKFQTNDVVIAVKAPGAAGFRQVRNWRDVVAILSQSNSKASPGDIVFKVKRDSQEVEIPVGVMDRESTRGGR